MNPLPKFPTQIETERLILRMPLPGDGIVVSEAIRDSFEDLNRWMAWADHVPNAEEMEGRILNAHQSFLADLDYVIYAFLKSDNAFVVSAGLHRRSADKDILEIGYWAHTAYQGNGYVGEVVQALTKAGFEILKARKIEIHCRETNLRSQRVAERAGFNYERTIKGGSTDVQGSVYDMLVYGMRRDRG